MTARPERRADCSRCVALCCVGPAFAASADFAIDKPAGTPCPNLRADHACGIHAELRERGFGGCAVFDCFGAGQQVVQVTFRGGPREPAMLTAFEVLRPLHEMLWYLDEALDLAPELAGEVSTARDGLETLVVGDADTIATVDVQGVRRPIGDLLGRVSTAVRGDRGVDRRGADLIGADLRRTDLRDATLRGAYLIGADLRGRDLTRADLLGADLRAADVRGAALKDSLFVTGPQLEAAIGDATTTVPRRLGRPAHWARR